MSKDLLSLLSKAIAKVDVKFKLFVARINIKMKYLVVQYFGYRLI